MHSALLPPRNRHEQQRHSGQILIMVALGMFVLLGFVALSVDVGYALNQRRGLQTAADASALAVASAVMAGTTNQTVIDNTASSYAAGNGFPDATVNVSVTGDSSLKTVTVNLTSEVPKFFIGVIYHGDWKVSTHAEATVVPRTGNYALLVLDETDEDPSPAHFIGNSNVRVLDGGAMSNSSMQCWGNARIYADETIDANKGYKTQGNCSFNPGKTSNPSAAIVPDPLKNVPPPPKPEQPAIGEGVTCTGSGNSYSCPTGALNSDVKVKGNDGSITFSAGDHQIIDSEISGAGNGPTITFGPGTYYFKNSTLAIGGNSSSLKFMAGTYLFYFENSTLSISGNSDGFSADGVNTEFYFDKDSSVTVGGNTSATTLPSGIYYFDGTSTNLTGNKDVSGVNVLFFFDNDATFDTGGNTQYNFTAAATSLYPGGQDRMLFYAARGSEGVFNMQGNSSSNMDGIVYLPSAELELGGNPSGIWANGQLIVNKIYNHGNTDIKIQYEDYVDITTPKIYLSQ